MKGQNKSKKERLDIVMNIIKKLKYFPRSNFFTHDNVNELYVNLFNEEYPAIKELKKVFDEYINQDESNLYNMSGKIKFQEINKKIKYTLPIKKHIEPIFVLTQL